MADRVATMGMLFPHSARTGDITVRVSVSYLAEQSAPADDRWFWSYHIRIENGGEKCVFIYNAHKNQFRQNLFAQCQIGIHFTAGSEQNSFAGNAVVGNRTQVKYVGSKALGEDMAKTIAGLKSVIEQTQ